MRGLHGEKVRADETTMTTRWTRDPRKPPKPKAPTPKLDAPLEAYPATCDRCGHTATRAGGCVEITDAIIIFSWLFTGGAAPAPPSPASPGYRAEECDSDATDDAIGCEGQAVTCG